MYDDDIKITNVDMGEDFSLNIDCIESHLSDLCKIKRGELFCVMFEKGVIDRHELVKQLRKLKLLNDVKVTWEVEE